MKTIEFKDGKYSTLRSHSETGVTYTLVNNEENMELESLYVPNEEYNPDDITCIFFYGYLAGKES